MPLKNVHRAHQEKQDFPTRALRLTRSLQDFPCRVHPKSSIPEDVYGDTPEAANES